MTVSAGENIAHTGLRTGNIQAIGGLYAHHGRSNQSAMVRVLTPNLWACVVQPCVWNPVSGSNRHWEINPAYSEPPSTQARQLAMARARAQPLRVGPNCRYEMQVGG